MNEERGHSRSSRVGWLIVGLLVGFAAGVGAGGSLSRFSVEPPPVAAAPLAATPSPFIDDLPTVSASDPSGGAEGEALVEAWMTNLWLAGKVQSLESLIEDIEAWDIDPTWLAERVVGSLDGDDLRAAISMATRLGDEELDEIEDMDAFAMRLTEIAMEGTLVDGAEPLDAGEVQFGAGSADIEDPSMLTSRFDPDQQRIYAFFMPGDYAGREVMVKWYRTDEPKIMVFKRHSIGQRGEPEYVWLQPRAGWESGDYRVDVYTGDEAMTQLAMGRYSIE